jgi:hypothetical protein
MMRSEWKCNQVMRSVKGTPQVPLQPVIQWVSPQYCCEFRLGCDALLQGAAGPPRHQA